MELIENNREYTIDANTMLIEPVSYGNKLYSRVIQMDGEFHYPVKPTVIIKMNCLANCSTYEGRVNGSRYILGKYQKVPIMINSENNMFFFPTASPDQPCCIWINPIHIHKHSVMDKKKTFVIFKNNQTLIIPISYHVFNNQLNKTMTLQNKMIQKNHENKGQRLFLYQNHARISEQVSDRNQSAYKNFLDQRHFPE